MEADTETTSLLNGENDTEGRGRLGNTKLRRSILWTTIVLGMVLGLFVIHFDISFVGTQYQRALADALHTENEEWIIISGSISNLAVQPVVGKIRSLEQVASDEDKIVLLAMRYTRPYILAGSTVLLFVGYLLCGESKNLVEMSGSQALVGTGSAAFDAFPALILSDHFSAANLATWIGILRIVKSFGRSLGAPAGSAILKGYALCRVFNIEATIAFFACLSLVGHVRYSQPVPTLGEEVAMRTTRSRDFAKALLFMFSVASPVSALDFVLSPIEFPGKALTVVALLISTVVAGILLLTTHWGRIKSFGHPEQLAILKSVLSRALLLAVVLFANNMITNRLARYTEVNAGSTVADWIFTISDAGTTVGIFLPRIFEGWSIRLRMPMSIALLLYIFSSMLLASGRLTAGVWLGSDILVLGLAFGTVLVYIELSFLKGHNKTPMFTLLILFGNMAASVGNAAAPRIYHRAQKSCATGKVEYCREAAESVFLWATMLSVIGLVLVAFISEQVDREQTGITRDQESAAAGTNHEREAEGVEVLEAEEARVSGQALL